MQSRKAVIKYHIPVLLNEVIYALDIKKGGIYVDCTFGSGGCARKILELGGKIIAFDRDDHVQPFVHQLSAEYQFFFFQKPFSKIKKYVQMPVDGIIADLGVSSMQLDTPERGFSFRYNAPLDMRMGCNTISAFDVINNTSYNELLWILTTYGEERFASKIVRAIEKNRPLHTTYDLAHLIEKIKPHNRNKKTHPATKTFQAIRIYVNQEIHELELLLKNAPHLLKKGGKLAVITFHSLEDRLIKQFWTPQKTNRYAPISHTTKPPIMIANKKIKPSREEIIFNPRARSAILRSFTCQ